VGAFCHTPPWPQFGLYNIVEILREDGHGKAKSAKDTCDDAVHSVFHRDPSNAFVQKYELNFLSTAVFVSGRFGRQMAQFGAGCREVEKSV
tara:strand:+ start:178 stop:450 length:273 start_codon:yes stop_codon:yes gene_type:complete